MNEHVTLAQLLRSVALTVARVQDANDRWRIHLEMVCHLSNPKASTCCGGVKSNSFCISVAAECSGSFHVVVKKISDVSAHLHSPFFFYDNGRE